MMFDIESLKAKETFELHITHPVTGAPLYADGDEQKLPVLAHLYSTGSKKYRTAMNTLQNRRLKRKDKEITAEVLQADAVDILVACSDKIDNLAFEGVPVDNSAVFRSMYSSNSYDWLKQQIDAALGDVSNFIEAQ